MHYTSQVYFTTFQKRPTTEMKGGALVTSLAVLVTLTPSSAAPSDVSHEDIRDAILSLVTIFRDNSEKLERHEYRERQLGDQLKKALAGLDKRYRSQDQAILQISERLKNLESYMQKKEEREQLQMLKVGDTVDRIERTINKVTKELEGSTKGLSTAYTIQDPMDSSISNKLDRITASLEAEEQNKATLRETERLLRSIDSKISNGGGNVGISGNTDVGNIIERQRAAIDNVLSTVLNTAEEVRRLPTKWDIQDIVNGSTEVLQEVRNDLLANGDKGTAMVISKLSDKLTGLESAQEDVMKTATEIQSMTEGFNAGVSQSYEQLLTEVRALSTMEKVMIQTADNVMDTKRRIEYGVHQILLEVGELIKHQGKNLNGTVNRRFDDIESTILDNQSGAISNLTTTIEQEISQVWRQIGIMYQQLTASATALDRLQQQTDAYVNGSVKVMDSMEGKVGMITSKMTEADENLNFLLGKLSMVTSEYNQIKSGLAAALDDIRNSFVEVQGKLKDLGPGPRPISDESITGNDINSG